MMLVPNWMPIEILKVDGKEWRTVLEQMAKYLVKKRYVKDTYVSALITREESYPTGIKIPTGVNVAIPHADVEHVIKQALVIGVPKEPVTFHNIEDPEDTVDVEIILLLVIKDPNGYVAFLSNLTRLFQDKNFVNLVEKKAYKELADLIVRNCLKGKQE